ncbi:MAG: radical SAM protein [Candidatus Omnitrophota bacterium]
MTKDYKYIYGPVSSWRLGRSLGVDLISAEVKVCSFDCVYCQLGYEGDFIRERRVFVDEDLIIDEIKSLPQVEIDYITFSGKGEPTLAKNLSDAIKAVRELRKEKIAVITNSSLIYRDDVQQDLMLADFVIAKLDASSEDLFRQVNKPVEGIAFNEVVKGLKEFRRRYKGKLALQIMFIDKNKAFAEDIAKIARDIFPDEVELNTPLRPCGVKPLSRIEIDEIKEYFEGLNTLSVYDIARKKTEPISKEDTLKRRGKDV